MMMMMRMMMTIRMFAEGLFFSVCDESEQRMAMGWGKKERKQERSLKNCTSKHKAIKKKIKIKFVEKGVSSIET